MYQSPFGPQIKSDLCIAQALYLCTLLAMLFENAGVFLLFALMSFPVTVALLVHVTEEFAMPITKCSP